MTHMHAKGQSQRSLGSKVRVETVGQTDGPTDGRTEATALGPTSRANAVGNYYDPNTCISNQLTRGDMIGNSFFLTRKKILMKF